MFIRNYDPSPRSATDITFGMIVRNGGRSLKACLESVSALCEEIIVVDTGSSDHSRDIAQSFGAKVIDAKWTNDFAAARNIYVERAQCGWILSLDADEVLGRLPKIELAKVLNRCPRTAFTFEIRNYFLEDSVPPFVLPSRQTGDAPAGMRCVLSKTIRLFPKRAGIRYSYPVHESLVPAIQRTDMRVCRCLVPIHHFGGIYDRETSLSKLALYRVLGQEKIARYPSYFLGYLELGQLYLRTGNIQEAASLFRRALALRPRCIEAQCFAMISLLLQGRLVECRKYLQDSQRFEPTNADLRYVHHLLKSAECSQLDR